MKTQDELEKASLALEADMDAELDKIAGERDVDSDPADADYWFKDRSEPLPPGK